MNTTVETFHYNGKRYAVSYHKISVDNYDPGSRLAPDIYSTDKTKLRKVYKKNGFGKRYQTKRSMIMCIVREAYTGQPYSGIAIMSPGEKNKSDDIAMKMAFKRAIYSLANDIVSNQCSSYYVGYNAAKETAKLISWAYRTEMLKKYNPQKYLEIKAEGEKRELAKIKADRARRKHLKFVAKSNGNGKFSKTMDNFRDLPLAYDPETK